MAKPLTNREVSALIVAATILVYAVTIGFLTAPANQARSFNWTAFGAALAGLAAIAQGASSVLMLRSIRHSRDAAEAAQASLDLTRTTITRQLRAYICFDDADIVDIPPEPPNIKLKFRNFGQTPARNVRITCRVRFESQLRTESPIIDIDHEEPKAGATTGHGGEFSLTVAPGVWTDALRENLISWRSRKTMMVVYGTVSYTDIFGNLHYTRFNLETSGGPYTDLIVGHLGNDAT